MHDGISPSSHSSLPRSWLLVRLLVVARVPGVQGVHGGGGGAGGGAGGGRRGCNNKLLAVLTKQNYDFCCCQIISFDCNILEVECLLELKLDC